LQPGILLLGRIRSTLFHALSLRFLTEFTTSAFINCRNSLPHVTILVNQLHETATTFNPILSLFSRWEVRHKPGTNLPSLQIS
jgi:hypothetical protein